MRKNIGQFYEKIKEFLRQNMIKKLKKINNLKFLLEHNRIKDSKK